MTTEPPGGQEAATSERDLLHRAFTAYDASGRRVRPTAVHGSALLAL